MKYSRVRRASLLLALLLAASGLSACRSRQKPAPSPDETDKNQSLATDGLPTGAEGTPDTSVILPETAPEAVTVGEPTAGTYTGQTDAVIRLTGGGAEVEGKADGVHVSDSVVTITRAGTYLLSGVLENGQLVVDTSDTEKVKLILCGVSVSCQDGPALLVKSAPKKVILYTAAGSVNLFSDGANYIVPDDQQVEGGLYPNACIYACDDLKLDGEGILQVSGNADKGINTKDDLEICGGKVNVRSVGTAVRGKDSVEMSGGTVTLTVTGEGDGIKTANADTEGKGNVSVSGGSLFITCVGDGISAAKELTVTGGHLVVTTMDAGGKELKEPTSQGTTGGAPGGFGGFGGRPGMEGNANKPSISAKGLKAGGNITLSGGKLTLTTVDDGLHAGNTVLISDGELYIRAGDDGIHADKVLTISGGSTEVAQSYEGLEANKINILGGTNRITASDDGTNANGGTAGGMGGPGGNRPGGGMRPGRASDPGAAPAATDTGDTPLLTIAGGYTVVNAGGDGIDSNGNIVMTGGVLYVFGPSDNGNGAIDYGDGNCSMTISGGTLLAVGSSGMAQAPANNGQAVFAASTRTSMTAGTKVGLCDADGRVLIAFELPKSIASIVFSSPELVAGSEYTVVTGGSASGEIIDCIIPAEGYTGFTPVGAVAAK